jgi:hypothetical protein
MSTKIGISYRIIRLVGRQGSPSSEYLRRYQFILGIAHPFFCFLCHLLTSLSLFAMGWICLKDWQERVVRALLICCDGTGSFWTSCCFPPFLIP